MYVYSALCGASRSWRWEGRDSQLQETYTGGLAERRAGLDQRECVRQVGGFAAVAAVAAGVVG